MVAENVQREDEPPKSKEHFVGLFTRQLFVWVWNIDAHPGHPAVGFQISCLCLQNRVLKCKTYCHRRLTGQCMVTGGCMPKRQRTCHFRTIQ